MGVIFTWVQIFSTLPTAAHNLKLVWHTNVRVFIEGLCADCVTWKYLGVGNAPLQNFSNL